MHGLQLVYINTYIYIYIYIYIYTLTCIFSYIITAMMLSNFSVDVYTAEEGYKRCGLHTGAVASGGNDTLHCNPPLLGSMVRITLTARFLVLCEVEVYATIVEECTGKN